MEKERERGVFSPLKTIAVPPCIVSVNQTFVDGERVDRSVETVDTVCGVLEISLG